MVAVARTWQLVTAALVCQLTSVAPAPLCTAPSTTRVVTVVLVSALGCATVHLATQVTGANNEMSPYINILYTSSEKRHYTENTNYFQHDVQLLYTIPSKLTYISDCEHQ